MRKFLISIRDAHITIHEVDDKLKTISTYHNNNLITFCEQNNVQLIRTEERKTPITEELIQIPFDDIFETGKLTIELCTKTNTVNYILYARD